MNNFHNSEFYFRNSNILKYFLLCFFVIICSSCGNKNIQNIKINRVDDFSKNVIEIDDAQGLIQRNYNAGNYLPNVVEHFKKLQDTLVILREEQISFSYDIINNSESKVVITLDVSSPKSTTYRVLPISDWYSEGNPNKKFMEFYPDALFRINNDLLQHGLAIEPKEHARIRIGINDLAIGSQKVELTFTLNKQIHKEYVNINVLDVLSPTNEFNNIVFNQINQQSNNELVSIWKETGFTHLQVNYIPTVTFDKKGNPLQKKIDHSTSNSAGFRNTAYPWIREGGTILLFWEPRYDKLAPLESGSYLKPFSPEWLNAFRNLIHIIHQDLTQNYPNSSNDQLILYLADEVSRFRETEEKNGYIQLSKFLEREIPNLKTLLTYGHYTDKSVVDSFEGIDYHVPHIRMPSVRSRNGINVLPQTVFKSNKLEKSKKWMYSIERGKRAPLYKFYALPAITAAQGYTGFSWYSFADHSGSTWDATDGNRLDYSLYYYKELKNPIYRYWSKRLKTEDLVVNSLRLEAIKKGISDAKIIRWLMESKSRFIGNDRLIVDGLLLDLQNIDIELNSDNLLNKSINYYTPVSSRNLRLLYARLKNDYKL